MVYIPYDKLARRAKQIRLDGPVGNDKLKVIIS